MWYSCDKMNIGWFAWIDINIWVCLKPKGISYSILDGEHDDQSKDLGGTQYRIFATQTWRGIRETVFQIWQPHGPHASKTESFASCSGLLAICTLFPRVSWAHSSPVVRLSDCSVQLKWSRWYSETGYACSFWIRHLVSESDIQFLNPEFLNPVEFLNRTSFQLKSLEREMTHSSLGDIMDVSENRIQYPKISLLIFVDHPAWKW